MLCAPFFTPSILFLLTQTHPHFSNLLNWFKTKTAKLSSLWHAKPIDIHLNRIPMSHCLFRASQHACAGSILHCDPHPGNLKRTPDGRLCILDWGLVTSLQPDLQQSFIEHIAHLTSKDYAQVSGGPPTHPP